MDFKRNIKPQIDPSTMKINEVLAYKGIDYQRWQLLKRNYRGAMKTVLIPVGLIFMCRPLLDHFARKEIAGDDNKGGSILDVNTIYTKEEMEYGREFQRMRYLTEPLIDREQGQRSTEQFLTDNDIPNGVNKSRHDLKKKAPHYKYY